MADSPSDNWPEYFQPRAGQEAPQRADTSLRLPTGLLDLFYLRRAADARAALVAVVACLGGAIAALPATVPDALDESLREQMQILKVNSRDRFRLITAAEVYLFRLDAMKQSVRAAGFNDAVFLYGRMQARCDYVLEELQLQALENEGRLTIGRLDLLRGIRQSLADPLAQPTAADQRTYRLFLPIGPPAETQRGRALALLYPTLDPDVFAQTDNAAFTMQIAYDLLLTLQAEMREAGVAGFFTNALLPVPDRRAVEQELEASGYRVSGDLATKRADWDATAAGKTFLGRVRRFAEAQSAPQITVPRQATPRDYIAAIDDALDLVATREDREAMRAVTERVVAQFTAAQAKRSGTPAPKPPASKPSAVQPAERAIPLAPPSARRAPEKPAAPDVAHDFAAGGGRPAGRATPPPTAWWDDFEGDADAEMSMTTSTRDFAPPPPRHGTGTPAPDVPRKETADARTPSAWRSDFSTDSGGDGPTDAGRAPKKDWQNDFSSRE